ncbi:uncharacterized protein ARMOST_21176 [Armillaria ostoyae]|uniref:Uncharacterized protein n=1 Tax=Armillaria ostoyae TaxID=47428 RepID=A0A284S9D0_ARMOS|nr:uncharacterized protein ARMOST_21176 [Armillaria ostoyae]
MSVPRTMAEELAPIIGQIEALETFLRCEKEEEDLILADEERLERELYAYSMASEALLALRKRKVHEDEPSSREASTSNSKLATGAGTKLAASKVGRGKSLRGKEFRT